MKILDGGWIDAKEHPPRLENCRWSDEVIVLISEPLFVGGYEITFGFYHYEVQCWINSDAGEEIEVMFWQPKPQPPACFQWDVSPEASGLQDAPGSARCRS